MHALQKRYICAIFAAQVIPAHVVVLGLAVFGLSAFGIRGNSAPHLVLRGWLCRGVSHLESVGDWEVGSGLGAAEPLASSGFGDPGVKAGVPPRPRCSLTRVPEDRAQRQVRMAG